MSDDQVVSKNFKLLTYFLIVMTYILVILGGYVKAIGAGLACPDWPLCYGKIFPFLDGNIYPFEPYMIFAEWIHRLIAILTGFVMLSVTIAARRYRENFGTIYKISLLGLILFIVQGLFGGLTVIGLLKPAIVVAHLGTAVLIMMLEMALAIFVTLQSR